ncbi:glycosyltransferase [Winogradskyella sp.]|nr:glycosyltransferase [Winogradskyella sp.]MDC1505322.1 glycosyltransferase [Winogradskyella sp.]
MKQEKIKIIFVLPNLQAGGAERVVSFVAQKLNPEIFDTTLVIIGYKKNAVYDLDSTNIVFFNKPRVQSGVVDLFKYIKRHKPQIVFSAVGHLNNVTAQFTWLFPKIKFVAREVNVLSVLAQFSKRSSRFNIKSKIAKGRFNRFDKVICQSQDMLDDLLKTYSIKPNKLVIINNPVTSSFKLKTDTKVSDPIQFITVARLVKQKGHARLIEVLGKLDFPFKYTIVGDGPEKNNILKRAKALDFIDSIENIPFTKNVSKYLEKSDLYLQGSFVEGFPNAIIESCMVGTPILAFNAPGGINEIIKPGINGYVVENEKQYIDHLKKIKSSYNFTPSKVSETVSSRYSESIIIKKYENLFISILKK